MEPKGKRPATSARYEEKKKRRGLMKKFQIYVPVGKTLTGTVDIYRYWIDIGGRRAMRQH